MPRSEAGSGFRFSARAQQLSFDEILRVARVAAEMGVTKIRLTGGEPLLRDGIADLVRSLRAVRGLTLTMTTNGSRLAQCAAALADAGLDRVTVSLDSLDEDALRAMCGAPVSLARILEGIDAAERHGLGPVKINTVVRRGINDRGVVDLARMGREYGRIVRFIEYMDAGTVNGWRPEDVVPSAEIAERIGAVFPLGDVVENRTGEVAVRIRYADGGGEFGVISSVTKPFCGACDRARLSAEGQLFTCLFGTSGTDLRKVLRAAGNDDDLRSAIFQAWNGRSDRYSQLRGHVPPTADRVEMSHIGG